MIELVFSEAEPNDAEQLADLINSAYRGDTSRQGWTTEADLLDGKRTDAADIGNLLAQPDSIFLLCRGEGELLGVVHLQKVGQDVQIGMLTVKPTKQDRGIGKRLLQAAEDQACRRWAVRRATLAVIPCRTELIAFYERRGYRCSGASKVFPQNPELWIPKVAGLSLKILEKPLAICSD